MESTQTAVSPHVPWNKGKTPRTPEFAERLVKGLDLPRDEERALRAAADASRRKGVIEPDGTARCLRVPQALAHIAERADAGPGARQGRGARSRFSST